MRVLLVDDEQDLLEQAKVFLEKNNTDFDVYTVKYPDKALDKIKEDSFDIIVSDYQMPRMDGLEFLRTIREERELDIPFVMFTGKGREEVAMEALNLGADRYLQKGGSPKSQYGVLSEAIQQEVEHRRTRKSLEARKKQFERAIQHAPYPAMLLAEDGEVLSINNEWTKVTGYDLEDISHINEWIEKAYSKNKETIKSDIIELFNKDHRVDEGTYTIETKDGEKKKWDFSTSPLGELPDGRRLILSMANDITERKKREEEVKRESKKAQKYLNIAGVMIVVIDPEGKVKEINKKGCQILGYDKEDIIGKDWFENFVPDDAKNKVMKNAHKPLISGDFESSMKYENPILTKDGKERLIKWENSVLKDDEGDVIATLSSGMDVTDIRKAEKKYQAITEKSHDAIFVIGSKNILFVNERAEELTGYDKTELYKMNWLELIHPDDRGKVLEIDQKGKKGEDVRTKYEARILTKNNDTRYGDFRVAPIEYGEDFAILGTVRDVTERKKKEKELQEERNFLEQIAETSPVCITEVNSEGKIIYANDRAEDVLGLSKSKIKGRTYHDIKWNITDYEGNPFPEEKLPFIQVKEKEGPVYGIKHAIEWPDGQWKYLSINASPIFDDEGEFDGMVATIENVTEKERNERKLKESRRRLKTLMDNMPGMAYRCKNNRNWTMKFLSDGCQDLTGYETEDILDDEVIPFREIIHPEDREYVWNRIQDAVGEGEPFKFEYRIRTKEGKIKWVWEKGRKVKIDDEVYLEGIMTDVTERKKIEEKLRKSEEKYKNLFYETPLGTIYYNKNGVIKDCNQKFVDIIGSSKEDLIGFDMLNRLKDEKLHREVKSSLENGEGYYEGMYESITADKSTPVRIILKGMKNDDGDIYAGIGLIEDITEQKEKEKQVEKEKERYERFFEENPEALVEVDNDFNVLKANTKFEKLFNYKEENILGKHLDDLVVPENKEGEAYKLNKKSKNKGYFDHETIRETSDGTEITVAITGRPIEHGGKTHHLAVYRDISERKKAEKREDFLHSLLRHDVRNKAQLAKGYLELLEESCTDEIERDYIYKASRSVKEAEEIINKVSKLRKIEEEEEIKDIDLSIALNKVVSELKKQLKDKDININIKKCNCKVRGGVLLEELFYNILENSIKHSRCSKIKIRVDGKDDECIVILEDDGKGIPNRYKNKIFEKGFKKGKTAGSGLGMYMVKEIAENYGGKIEVEDSDLGGVKFIVHLKK